MGGEEEAGRGIGGWGRGGREGGGWVWVRGVVVWFSGNAICTSRGRNWQAGGHQGHGARQAMKQCDRQQTMTAGVGGSWHGCLFVLHAVYGQSLNRYRQVLHGCNCAQMMRAAHGFRLANRLRRGSSGGVRRGTSGRGPGRGGRCSLNTLEGALGGLAGWLVVTLVCV